MVRKSYFSDHFGRCPGLHRSDLVGHFGCVNAVEFSNNGGEFIVSGGDDRRVMVWNVEKCVYGTGTPVSLKGEHKSNIFCTVFDNENRHLFSAGNDNMALRHDFETGETVGMYYHDDPVYGLHVHPEDSNVFLTASDDGKVLLWDIRASSVRGSSSCVANLESAFHAAVFNPVDYNVIATANSKKGVQLWDMRVPISCLKQFSCDIGQMCAMGLKWNTTGDMITALRRRLPPVLYHVKRSSPIAEFHHPGYSNVCTMKSNCFAGSKDQYVVSGSDDFNVYIWEVPDDWDDGGLLITVGRAFLVLQGHRSIVNQVRFNRANHMLISAGVEKVLKVWSPFPVPGGCSSTDVIPGNVRQPYSHSDYLGFIQYGGLPLSHDEYENRSTEEDPRMLAFFDSLIEREKENFCSDSDDSTWEDLHLSLILQGGSSEDSDNGTIGTSVNRLLARELLHRPTQRSPEREPSANTSGQGALRRLRYLKNAAVIRDLLNRDSSSSSSRSSDEETGNCIPLNELASGDDNGQNSKRSSVTFNRPRRNTSRRYRFRSRIRTEGERSRAASDSSSNSEDQNTGTKTEANSKGNVLFVAQGNDSCSTDNNKVYKNTDDSDNTDTPRLRITCENGNVGAACSEGHSCVEGQEASRTLRKGKKYVNSVVSADNSRCRNNADDENTIKTFEKEDDSASEDDQRF